MSTPRFGLPNIWVTHIAGLLSGEDQCGWSAYFKAHFQYDRVETDFDSVAYNTLHKELLNRRAADLTAAGWTVTKERANAFKLRGEVAVLGGKPDILAFKGGLLKVVDAKGGQKRDSHYWQLVMYMLALPRCRPELKGLEIDGELYYSNGTILPVRSSDITGDIAARVWNQIRETAFEIPPEKHPSEDECSFCPIPLSECADRMAVQTALGDTKEF